jgi:Ser/Thr protein kinase RdoA (MazF antagonist)
LDKQTENNFALNGDFILKQASRYYGFAPDKLQRLGSFESFVFEYNRNGNDYILRVTPGSHRQPEKIHGELEWLNYLADNDVSVARAVESGNGSLIEVVELDKGGSRSESFYSVVAFEKARGGPATKDDWNDKLFTNWGQIVGRMHALTKNYQPSHPSYTRHTWHEDEDLKAHEVLPPTQTKVLEKYDSLMKTLKALPTDRGSYGLVHEDMHHSNFFVDNGRITAFDFDDCQYHWFASDIGIPLFYVMQSKRLNDTTPEFARRFFGCFMEGYSRENRIDRNWLERIPLFHRLREMILYVIIYDEEAFEVNGWCRDYFQGRQERIENDIPVIDIDFSRFG